jgi:hypothetical protein
MTGKKETGEPATGQEVKLLARKVATRRRGLLVEKGLGLGLVEEA